MSTCYNSFMSVYFAPLTSYREHPGGAVCMTIKGSAECPFRVCHIERLLDASDQGERFAVMCNTDLKIAAVNKEIEINDAKRAVLVATKRVVSLNGRICMMIKAGNVDDVEVARLKRNIAAASLDIANLDYEMAQLESELKELTNELASETGRGMAAKLVESMFGAMLGGFAEDEGVDSPSMGFGGLTVDDMAGFARG